MQIDNELMTAALLHVGYVMAMVMDGRPHWPPMHSYHTCPLLKVNVCDGLGRSSIDSLHLLVSYRRTGTTVVIGDQILNPLLEIGFQVPPTFRLF